MVNRLWYLMAAVLMTAALSGCTSSPNDGWIIKVMLGSPQFKKAVAGYDRAAPNRAIAVSWDSQAKQINHVTAVSDVETEYGALNEALWRCNRQLSRTNSKCEPFDVNGRTVFGLTADEVAQERYKRIRSQHFHEEWITVTHSTLGNARRAKRIFLTEREGDVWPHEGKVEFRLHQDGWVYCKGWWRLMGEGALGNKSGILHAQCLNRPALVFSGKVEMRPDWSGWASAVDKNGETLNLAF